MSHWVVGSPCGLKFFLMGQRASTFSCGLEMLLHLPEAQFLGFVSFRIPGTPLSTPPLVHCALGTPPSLSNVLYWVSISQLMSTPLLHPLLLFLRSQVSPVSSLTSLSVPSVQLILSAPTCSFSTMSILKTLLHFAFLSLCILHHKMGIHYIWLPYREGRSWGRSKCSRVVSGGIHEL